MLNDVVYVTHPLHGPAVALRSVVIQGGVVCIDAELFAQQDFFKVNVLVSESTAK